MPVEVDQELRCRNGCAEDRLGILGLDLLGRKSGDDGWDRVLQVRHAVCELLSRNRFQAEFQITLPVVGQVAKLAADILPEIAFEVEGEIACRVGDAGKRLPQRLLIRKGLDLLDQAGEVASEEGGQIRREAHGDSFESTS